MDKKFFNTTFINKFLFDIELEEYEEILEKCKIQNVEINNDEKIEETHKKIVDETFEQLEKVRGVESKFLLYFLLTMYSDKFTKKQLEQKLSEFGDGERVYITENNRKKRVRIRKINIINNKNNNNVKTEVDLLKEKNNELMGEIKQLKQKLFKNKLNLNKEIELEKSEFRDFKKFLIDKKIITDEQLKEFENNEIDKLISIF